jgi:hypothetical protein
MGAASAVSSVLGFGMNVAGSEIKRNAATAEYNDQYQASTNNVGVLSQAGADAVRRGEQQESASRMKYGAVRGQQAANYGASGVAVGSGSPVDTLANTDAMSAYDAAIIRNNAAREAWGYRSKAKEETRKRGQLGRAYSNMEAESQMGVVGSFIGSSGGIIGGASGK